jgi:FMN phosphatase YigB (HAD superfamily)
MPKEWFEYILKHWPISKKFNMVILSSQIGKVKGVNLSRMVLRLCKKQGIKPEECLVVDDKLKNIRIFESLSIRGIVYKNNENFKKKLSKILLKDNSLRI